MKDRLPLEGIEGRGNYCVFGINDGSLAGMNLHKQKDIGSDPYISKSLQLFPLPPEPYASQPRSLGSCSRPALSRRVNGIFFVERVPMMVPQRFTIPSVVRRGRLRQSNEHQFVWSVMCWFSMYSGRVALVSGTPLVLLLLFQQEDDAFWP